MEYALKPLLGAGIGVIWGHAIASVIYAVLDGVHEGFGSIAKSVYVAAAIAIAFGLITSLVRNDLEASTDRIRSAIWRSARSGVFGGLLIGLIFGITGFFISTLTFNFQTSLSFDRENIANNALFWSVIIASIGFVGGFLVFGGYACISHPALRFVLRSSNAIPPNYPEFLDYAAERLFLRKVGRGYIFVHRLLLDHFVTLYTGPLIPALPPLDRGRNYYNDGHYEEAVIAYQEAIELDPKDYVAYKELGDTYRAQGKVEQILPVYVQASSLGWKWQEYILPPLIRGLLSFELGLYRESISAYQEAIKQDPEDSQLYALLGEAHYNNHADYERAVAAFEEAITLSPQDARLYMKLGDIYSNKGISRFVREYKKAITAYQQAIALDAHLLPPYYRLGSIYRSKGENTKALEVLQSALKICTTDEDRAVVEREISHTYNALGRAKNAHHDYSDAIIAYQRSLDTCMVSEDRVLVLRNMADTYEAMGEYDKAITVCQQAIALSPKDAQLYRVLGDMCRTQRYFPEAIKAYSHAIDLVPEMDEVHVSIAKVHQTLKHYPEAIAEYRRAIELNPDDPNPRISLAGIYRVLGSEVAYTEQLAAIKGLIEWEDEYSHARFAAVTGDSDRALEWLQAALDLNLRSPADVRKDEDFMAIHDDARFQALVNES